MMDCVASRQHSIDLDYSASQASSDSQNTTGSSVSSPSAWSFGHSQNVDIAIDVDYLHMQSKPISARLIASAIEQSSLNRASEKKAAAVANAKKCVKEKKPHVIARRNARERKRVQAVNSAFARLRRVIPYENKNKRLSKVKTLRIAIDYIRQLCSVLQNDADSLKFTPVSATAGAYDQYLTAAVTGYEYPPNCYPSSYAYCKQEVYPNANCAGNGNSSFQTGYVHGVGLLTPDNSSCGVGHVQVISQVDDRSNSSASPISAASSASCATPLRQIYH